MLNKVFYPVLLIFFSPFGCVFDKSDLPQIMPSNIVISFMENGGMINSYKKIVLSSAKCIYEYRDQRGKKETITFSVPDQQLEGIYNEFKRQSFDTIRTKKGDRTVTDMGSERITISFANRSYSVLSDSNFPFKTTNTGNVI